MSYLALARKWRPTKLDELTGQEPIAGILKNSIISGKVAHAYIFSGPRGVGKTSTARILAKTLNCEQALDGSPCGICVSCVSISEGMSMDVIEIDGASNTGVDNIRDLRERVKYSSYGGAYKVYIIDEAHMLSTAAFNALLKTLEEPPPYVIFVLATTDPRKIPATVMSRSQHLPFRRIPTAKIKERLKKITAAESMNIEDGALEIIARAADGSMRDSLTILDQVSSFADNITAADVKDLLGLTDSETLSSLASALICGDRKKVLEIVAGLVDAGTDLKSFAKDFLQFMRDLLVFRIVGDKEDILDFSEEEKDALKSVSLKTSEEHLALILSELVKSEYVIRNAFFPRVAFELLLLRLCMMSHFTDIDEAIRTLKSSSSKHVDLKSHNIESRKKSIDSRCADPQKTSDRDEKPARPENLSPEEVWNRVMARIDNENAPLAGKLKQAVISASEEEIKMIFNGGMAVIAEFVKENIPFLQDCVKDAGGSDLRIKIEIKEDMRISRDALKEKALNNPVVKEALDLFEGRIAEVYPMKENNGGNNVQ